ncbi:hypothetical protein cyc_03729 [Cyclospora cayetanensis]|uniref:Uncharacterized protein n=1 Tax=Cyclospora cayetanensis TaxID=88456 RepID=A0A1D3D9T6_9EIME|nr:hypothetical protein cyc_03729 [Cyclospora cayetanensis]
MPCSSKFRNEPMAVRVPVGELACSKQGFQLIARKEQEKKDKRSKAQNRLRSVEEATTTFPRIPRCRAWLLNPGANRQAIEHLNCVECGLLAIEYRFSTSNSSRDGRSLEQTAPRRSCAAPTAELHALGLSELRARPPGLQVAFFDGFQPSLAARLQSTRREAAAALLRLGEAAFTRRLR